MLTSLRFTVVLVGILVVVHPAPVAARENIYVMPWSRVAPLLPGARVTLELSDTSGTVRSVYGQAVWADGTGVTVRVMRSSDKSTLPRGLHRIPAAKIRRVTPLEPPEVTAAVTGMGAGIGGAAAAPLAMYLAEGKGKDRLGLLTFIGGAILGGWIGHHFDRGKTVFVVTHGS